MFKTEIKTKVKTRKTTAMCDTNLFRESEFKPTNITDDDYWLHCSLVFFGVPHQIPIFQYGSFSLRRCVNYIQNPIKATVTNSCESKMLRP